MLESMYAQTRKKPAAMPAPPGGASPLAAYLQKTANPVSDLLNSNRVAQANQPAGPPAPHTIADNAAPTTPTAAANVAKANTQAATGGTGPSMPKIDFNTDYSSDPVLQKMLMGGATDAADADTAALTSRRGVVSQLGDRNLASSVLGAGDPTLDSISDNPDTSTSTLARLKRAYGQTVKTNEDSINENNLWYGGEHGRVLGNLSKDYQTQVGDASTQAQAALDQIAAGLSSTKAGIRDKQQSAESAAADRKAQQLLAEILAGAGNAGNDSAPPPDSSGAGAADQGPVEPAAGQFWDPVKQMWVGAPARNQGYSLLQ
jgi:hypothetical protein